MIDTRDALRAITSDLRKENALEKKVHFVFQIPPNLLETMSDGWTPLTQPPSTYLPPTSADFYVKTLPGLSPNSPLTLFSGLLSATTSQTTPASSVDSDAQLYFLLAANRHIPVRPRLLIWLQGGSSSFPHRSLGLLGHVVWVLMRLLDRSWMLCFARRFHRERSTSSRERYAAVLPHFGVVGYSNLHSND